MNDGEDFFWVKRRKRTQIHFCFIHFFDFCLFLCFPFSKFTKWVPLIVLGTLISEMSSSATRKI